MKSNLLENNYNCNPNVDFDANFVPTLLSFVFTW